MTSSSLLHPTRLSMICARHPQHLAISGTTAGLEICSATIPYQKLKTSRTKLKTSRTTEAVNQEIYESLKKNQTGRPFSAPCGGPHRVLLPFLAEDLNLIY